MPIAQALDARAGEAISIERPSRSEAGPAYVVPRQALPRRAGRRRADRPRRGRPRTLQREDGPRGAARLDDQCDRNRLKSTVRRPLPLAFRELEPTVKKARVRPGDRDPARRRTCSRSTTASSDSPHLRRRDRAGAVPDAARAVEDRRQAAQPVVAAARLRVGEGREADPAGPGQSARHPLDGPDAPRRSGSTGRPMPPRSATRRHTGASGCACPTRSGCSSTSTSARPSSSPKCFLRSRRPRRELISCCCPCSLSSCRRRGARCSSSAQRSSRSPRSGSGSGGRAGARR